jgi:carbon-monoxide dehydrogenase small subunit
MSPTPSTPPTLGSQANDAERLPVSFTLNGAPVSTKVHPLDTLLELLRERLRLTGTKGACHEGECGSCTVLVNGIPMNSCLILAPQVQGSEIVTVEGLADGETLSSVQQAFLDLGAVQCGYCTPGLLLAAKAFLETCPDPSPEQIRKGLEGNICRCTGYVKIIDAVVAAAKTMPSVKGGRHE